jgi:hypothetical protein
LITCSRCNRDGMRLDGFSPEDEPLCRSCHQEMQEES